MNFIKKMNISRSAANYSIIVICFIGVVTIFACRSGTVEKPVIDGKNIKASAENAGPDVAEPIASDTVDVPNGRTPAAGPQSANQPAPITPVGGNNADPISGTGPASGGDQSKQPVAEDLPELKDVPDTIVAQVGFMAVKYYQKGNIIYLLTYTGPRDDEKTLFLRSAFAGGCSEIWAFNVQTGKLDRILVKFAYDPKISMNAPTGEIFKIDSIYDNGDIVFTETWNEGMEHYGSRAYKYVAAEEKVITLSYEKGRPELMQPGESERILSEVVSKDILARFKRISDIISDDNGNSSFNCFSGSRLYSVKYNLFDESRGYWHEIGITDITTGVYTPIIRKGLEGPDSDPLIFIESMDADNNLKIRDWCGFYTNAKSSQSYFFDAEKQTVIKQSGTEETGIYEVVKNSE